jgi:hypothetical protein
LTRAALDPEEERILAILMDARSRMTTARRALSNPTHLVLTPEYKKLVDDLKVARAEYAKATMRLRDHRKSR